MDSIDPGALLAAMSSGSGNGAPAPGNIDAQIMALLKQKTPRPDEGTNAQDANARAAQTAYQSAQSKPATLQVGLGPFLRTDTHIPIPHWLDQGLVGGGGDLYRQFANNIERPLGITPDPLKMAVNQQAQSTTAGRVGVLATEAAESVPLGMGTAGVLGKLGSLGARAAANPISLGAIQGATQGGLMADPGQRLQGAAFGGLLGGAIPAVGAVGGKIASGLSRTPEAQALLDRGVQLTPGQMNPGGLYNRVEQGLTGLPLVGGKIAQARGAAVPQFTKSLFKDALAPGDTLPPVADANAAIDSMRQGFDNAYSAVQGYPMKPAIVNMRGPDVPLARAFTNLANKPQLSLPPAQRAQMGQQLLDQLNNTIAVAKQSGGLMSDHLQALRSAIRDAARDVSPVDNASRAQRDFWNQAQQQVTKALESQLPPKTAAGLQAIDAQYGKFATLRDAVAAAKDRPEGPTLNQLSSAIQQATPKSVYAGGGGWNRDATKAAQTVFGNNVPLTGLTGAGTVAPIVRGVGHGLGIGAGIGEAAAHGGLSAAAAHPFGIAGTLGGLGALYGAYTRPGLRMLAGQTPWQQGLLQAGSHVSPATRRLIGAVIRGGLLGTANEGLQNQGLLSQPQ